MVIVPIAMLVTRYGARLAHGLNKRQMELEFVVFVSARLFWRLVG